MNKMSPIPIIVNTWGFTDATAKAWDVLSSGGSGLDAVVAGCTRCEELQCDGTVGYGGSPDEQGETTLDAMVMHGPTHGVGAVGSLRRVKNAVGVARAVMEHTQHTMLVGELATNFALEMGFKETSLSTNHSTQMWRDWKDTNCQPNFRKNVSPDPSRFCGPYQPIKPSEAPPSAVRFIDSSNHDTIGMLAVDHQGNCFAATSTNGARHKVPGRVGDSPLPGAGAYVDNEVGAAAATGDGDVMMRFLPSFKAVDLMRQGLSPSKACKQALSPVKKYYPGFSGAVVCVNNKGEHGAACHGLKKFPYSVRKAGMSDVSVVEIVCQS